MKNIVIFASGSGSNAEKIIDYFSTNKHARVRCILTNNATAKVIAVAKKNKIPTKLFDKFELEDGHVLKYLVDLKPDIIVLAGFLLQFPQSILQVFENKVINIHPALLPKYGGKGMYGINVHKAIFNHSESDSGITIHFVTEHYDEGAFIFQKTISISDCETPEEIAKKILQLEHLYYSEQIEKLLTSI